MDLATLVGSVGALGVIIAAILVGGSASSFIDMPSVLIVVAGTLLANLIKFPLSHTLSAFKVAGKAFRHRPETMQDLIDQSVNLAGVARKEGLLGLEGVDVSNEFLKRGIQMVVDGQKPELIERVLAREISLTIERHEQGQAIFKGIGDTAPAMGMIGTLVGLVQMMSNMSDPKAIGPAMAVALLTTLYGAVFANVFALPIADKLAHRSAEERRNRSMILESISAIQEGLNPRVIESLLGAYLPGTKRVTAEAA